MASITHSILLDEPEPGLCEVLNGFLQTCPEVLSAVYSSHYRYVLRVCRHFFPQQEDAQDAAAEVFMKLHTVLRSGAQPMRFRPWLSKVTGRHCIDKLRQRRRARCHPIEEEEFAALPDIWTPSPLAQVLLQEEQRQVREELRRLPRHYRIPLVLRYYRRMSYSEIARTLGRQMPAIKMVIFRAKRELRRRLLSLRCRQTAQDFAVDVLSPASPKTLVE
jgi:RNA polymerase sigma-70 factor (ECF subfamily)